MIGVFSINRLTEKGGKRQEKKEREEEKKKKKKDLKKKKVYVSGLPRGYYIYWCLSLFPFELTLGRGKEERNFLSSVNRDGYIRDFVFAGVLSSCLTPGLVLRICLSLSPSSPPVFHVLDLRSCAVYVSLCCVRLRFTPRLLYILVFVSLPFWAYPESGVKCLSLSPIQSYSVSSVWPTVSCHVLSLSPFQPYSVSRVDTEAWVLSVSVLQCFTCMTQRLERCASPVLRCFTWLTHGLEFCASPVLRV